MSDVKSKNLYELLGNTSDQDSDREPDPPTQVVDKATGRSGKRDAPKAAPAAPAPSSDAVGGGARGGRGTGRRGGGFSGSEAAFRDRTAGRGYNRDQPTGEGEEYGRPGRERGPGARGRGRGERGPRRGGDRHSRTGISEHQKQADQGWGAQTGEGELANEKAGDAIATEEIKEGGPVAEANPDATPVAEPEPQAEPEPEPEDTSKSYADYLAEQATKKLEGLGVKEARAPNEGTKDNKKWKGAKELVKNDDEATYFQGDQKARRERERKANKEFVDIDYSFKEPPRDGRGGRGTGRARGRGDRGDRGGERGEFRGGDRGDFRGRGRGEFSGRARGERGDRGERGEYRGRGRGRASDSPTVAVNDESAFPSLGSK